MATYTAIDLDDARIIGRQFGVQPTRLAAIAAGSVNSNYRLETAGGPSYLVRIYEEATAVDAEAEARLLQRLAAAGIPTPCPLARLDGRGVTVPAPASVGARPVALFPWRDGETSCQARVTVPVAGRVGALVARLHLALAGVAEHRTVRFGIAQLRSRLHSIPTVADPELRSVAPVIAERLDRAEAARDPTLPGGVVHGDLFRDNVLWRDGSIVAVLDFESAEHHPWAYDLMVTVLAWCYGDDLDLGLVRAMLAGYQTVRPLAPAERLALGPEGRIAALRFTITRITDFALRTNRESHVMKDWRRFRGRLARLDALGDAAIAALAAPAQQ